MRFVQFLTHSFLLAMLLSHCSSEMMTKSAISLQSENQTKQVNESPIVQSDMHKINFIDLNEDVLYLIFFPLDVIGFLQMTKTSPLFRAFVGDVFRRKFQDYEFEIVYANDAIHGQEMFHEFPNYHQIELYDYKLILNVLHYFGSMIKKLSITNYSLDDHRSTVIHGFVNEYVAATVKQLDLGTIKDDTLALFAKPLKEVEHFACSIGREQVGAILPFSQLFPKLKRLSISFNSDVDFNFVDCRMPLLERLTITIGTKAALERMKQIDGLIRKNPQIKSINCNSFPITYIEVVNKALPNIESLTVQNFYVANESLQFEQVKHFSVWTSLPVPIEKLSFPRIASLKMEYSPGSFDSCMAFFKRHHHLEKLDMKIGYAVSEMQLLQLMVELPNLIEVHFEFSDSINVDNIIELIQSHQKLMKMDFSTPEPNGVILEILRQRFEKLWFIRDCKHHGGVSLEKVNDYNHL